VRMNGGLERSRQTRRKLLKHGADIRAARSEWRLPDLYEGDCGIDVIGPLRPVETTTMLRHSFRRTVTRASCSIIWFRVSVMRDGADAQHVAWLFRISKYEYH
jgi:hypothetical protein